MLKPANLSAISGSYLVDIIQVNLASTRLKVFSGYSGKIRRFFDFKTITCKKHAGSGPISEHLLFVSTLMALPAYFNRGLVDYLEDLLGLTRL
jgi:hypothetical protein